MRAVTCDPIASEYASSQAQTGSDLCFLNFSLALWALVLTEGIGFIAEVEWEMKANLQRVYDVNVIGVIKTVRAFMPLLRKNKGRIVTIGGFAGMVWLTGGYWRIRFTELVYASVLHYTQPLAMRAALPMHYGPVPLFSSDSRYQANASI